MRRHVIRALCRVRVQRIAFRNQALQESIEVARSRRIRIFLNHQTGGGVLNENRTQTLGDARSLDDPSDRTRNFVQAATPDFDTETLNPHRALHP